MIIAMICILVVGALLITWIVLRYRAEGQRVARMERRAERQRLRVEQWEAIKKSVAEEGAEGAERADRSDDRISAIGSSR